jgi:CRISPR/Cas system endoribonuclease Cas6 (RAMP superfamily)
MALDRYSNRRGGKLELDGFMGDVTFAGPAIQELLPLLVAGEFLNVGSGTAFGLGRYRIVACT